MVSGRDEDGLQGVTAIVLAAGPGARLWPLTNTRPKPMVPVAGKPILQWGLEALVDAGIRRAVIVVGHKAATIQSHFQDGRDLGLELTYVTQKQQAGTAHAVACALEAGGMPEKALILGGDNVIDVELVRSLGETGVDSIAITRSSQPSKYGVVALAGDQVQSITEKPGVSGEALIWTGVSLLSRDALDRLGALVEDGKTDLPTVINTLIREGREIHASLTTGDWLDAVYPWDLVPMAELLLSYPTVELRRSSGSPTGAVLEGAVHAGEGSHFAVRSTVIGPTSVGQDVRIGPGAVVVRSILMDGVRVAPGAIIEDSVICEGAVIGAGAVLGSGSARAESRDGFHDVARIGAVVGEGAEVGAGAVLAPGAVLGADVIVRPGAIVRGVVPDGGWIQ